MDYYIIQKTEIDIDNELSNKLADILASDLGIHKIDAKTKIRHFYGMLKVPNPEQAKCISLDFRKAGLDNFIIGEDKLVALPQSEPLPESLENITELHGLIAAGIVHEEYKQKSRHWSPLSVKAVFAAPLIIDTGMRETQKTSKRATYYISIINRDKHWKITKSLFPQKEVKALEQIDLLKAYLSIEVRKMFQGKRNLRTFSQLKNYNQYLTWLLQLVHAKQR